MKTMLKLIMTVCCLLTIENGIANDPKVYVKQEQIFFEFDTGLQETAIKIMDEENNLIFSDTSLKRIYSKKFNLNKLKDGIYLLKVTNSQKELVYTIEVNAKKIAIKETAAFSKPFFRETEKTMYINFLNLKKTPVAVEVYDDYNNLVHSEKTDNQVVEKAVNFKSADKGTYTVVIKTKENSFYKQVEIQ